MTRMHWRAAANIFPGGLNCCLSLSATPPLGAATGVRRQFPPYVKTVAQWSWPGRPQQACDRLPRVN
eukprot:scaffold207_cov409-Prasinococcus_capsulatus_cf.AAC.139